jgi:hypothetical protein
MISVLLRGELCSRLILDEVPEDALTPLELARNITWLDPVRDVHLVALADIFEEAPRLARKVFLRTDIVNARFWGVLLIEGN